MLIKQLLNSARTSSKLLVYEPFRDIDREALVREVIGLANADVEGPRVILFGVNPGVVDGDGVVGISERAAGELKKAHRLVSATIEPALDLAFIYDRINGKLVGALEIDGCEFGPYFVGHDLSGSLSRGQCWIRVERELRAVERSELMQAGIPATVVGPVLLPEQVDVAVGFNGRPDCDFLEIPIPDTSNPPFAEEGEHTGAASTLVRAFKDTVVTVKTQIMRIGHGGAGIRIAEGIETGTAEDADRIFSDAQNHYYFEERAVKLDFSIRNRGEVPIDNVTIEFGFPRLPDFDVADRIYVSPFDKRSENEIRNMGYPEVDSQDDAIFVRSRIDSLGPGGVQPAMRCPLRLAVGPGMQGRKLGIRYTLRGPDGSTLGKGGLKIRFGAIED